MKILLSWLRDYVEWAGTAAELAELLTRMGIEVEALWQPSSALSEIVTARIVEVEPHPRAEQLRVCKVFDGVRERTVVCGAPNVAAGQVSALALPGAHTATGITIQPRVIRGVESEGMLCSLEELGIAEDASGIWVLDAATPVGVPLSELLAGEAILEISITPNRADALSHFGIARIVAAATGACAQLPAVSLREDIPATVTIELPMPQLCPRYAARVVDGVRVVPSPAWLRMRLELVGVRPRNAVVDVTNYVMLECGQPLHAFDFALVNGRTIIVRTARSGERLTTLDGIERELTPTALCICDAERPIALAGIMGGAHSAISDSTSVVMIESACFAPTSIRRTAKQLGMQTEASYRFERGVDIEMIPYALDRAAALVAELTGGRCSPMVESYPQPWTPPCVQLRIARAESILGIPVDRERVCAALGRMGFGITAADDASVTVRVPSHRHDVREEIDVIEEVAILQGYDSIPAASTAVVPFAALDVPEHLQFPAMRNRLRQFLAARGFVEALSYNLVDPATALDASMTVRVVNALGQERSALRQWLLPSMVEALSRNCRYGARSVRLFELGKVFARSDGIARESERLALGCAGVAVERQWYASERQFDVFDLKGAVEELLEAFGVECQWAVGQCNDTRAQWLESPVLSIVVEGRVIGYLGQLHPEVIERFDLHRAAVVAELDAAPLLRQRALLRRYEPPSPYPVVQRDVSLVVDETVTAAELADALRRGAGQLLQLVRPFDVFTHPSLGEGKKSVALSLVFASRERTLTDEEVNRAVAAAIAEAERACGAVLRSV